MKQNGKLKELQTHCQGRDMTMTWNCSNCPPSNPKNTETLRKVLSDEEDMAFISIVYVLDDYSGEEISESSKILKMNNCKIDANSTDNPLIVTLDDQKGLKGKCTAMYGFKSRGKSKNSYLV